MWPISEACALGFGKSYRRGGFDHRSLETYTFDPDDYCGSVEPQPFCVVGLMLVAMSVKECYLVDPASSHMLVSKIKPCMCKYELNQTVKLRMAH